MSDPTYCSSSGGKKRWKIGNLKGRLSNQAKGCDFSGETTTDLCSKEEDMSPRDVENNKEICYEDQRLSPPIKEATFSTGFMAQESNTVSKLTEISKSAHPYFKDLPALNSVDEPSEGMSSKNIRYFSTPMASKAQRKKMLTPVMEVDVESSGHLTLDEICRQDALQNDITNSDTAASTSPIQPPLYRSFFATECQEIVSELDGVEVGQKNLGKRKLDELDVSTIDTEPPPCDLTLMKSMLTSDMAHMISSLENSPNKGGESMFVESLLDLDNVDLQLHHFGLTEDVKYMHKSNLWKDCAIDGISHLGDDLDEEFCSKKRQKLEQLCEGEHVSLKSPKRDTEVLDQTNESPGLKRDMEPEEDLKTMSHNFTLEKGLLETMSLTLELERSKNTFPEENICNSSDAAQHDQSANEIEFSSDANVKSSANSTKDMTSIHEELTATFEKATADPKPSENILQSTIILDHDDDAANVTQVIERTPSPPGTVQNQLVTAAMKSANLTHDITDIQSVAPVAYTTLELDTANATQDVILVHVDVASAETSTVMTATLGLSPNATHEIVLVHDEVTAANSTHVIEAMPGSSANATQDLIPAPFELLAVNTSQVIEAVPLPSANITLDFAVPPAENSVASATQDIMPVDDEVITENPCPEKNIVPKIDAESSKGTVAGCSVHTSANTTLVIEDTGKLSQSGMGDVALVHRDDSTSPTQDIVLGHDGNSATSNAKDNELAHVSTTQNSAFGHDENVDANPATDVPPVLLQDSTLKEVRQMPQDEPLFVDKVLVDRMQVIGLANAVPATDCINTSHPAGSVDHTIEAPPDRGNTRSPTDLTAEDLLQSNALTQSKQEISQSVGQRGQLAAEDAKPNQPEVSCSKMYDMDASPGNVHDSSSQESMSEPGPCDNMQEAENIQDVSVFSVSSLSFVTSTPVPGLSNFHFKHPCKDSVQQDSNLSLCSVIEVPTEKPAENQKLSAPQSSLGTQPIIGNPHVKKEIPKGSLLYRGTQRSFLPQKEEASKLQPPTSGISSARRSLILNAGPPTQKAAKEPVLPQNPPKATAIPARGVLRPPLNRNSMLKTSMVNLKQGIGGTSGNILQSKLSGSRLKTPKATPKAKCPTSSSSSLVGSLVRPSSRLSLAGSGPLPAGGQSSNTGVQQTACGPQVSTKQLPAPSATRASGLVKPGLSSLRLSVPVQLQKSPTKIKCNLPGLPVRRIRELPKATPASTQSEAGTTKAGSCFTARTAPKKNLSASPKSSDNPVTSAGAQTNVEQAEKSLAESTGKIQSSHFSHEKTPKLPSASSVDKPPAAGNTSLPVMENCYHLKACPCCSKQYQQLLQELNTLKSCLENVQHPEVTVPTRSSLEGSAESPPL